MLYKVKLRIADVVIQMQSRFPHKELTKEEQGNRAPERYNNFIYQGRQKPHIKIKVEIVDKLPEIPRAEPVFITYHFQDNSENWRLLKRESTYIYKNPQESNKQIMLVNKAFDKVTAYLLPKDAGQKREVRKQKSESARQEKKEFVWNMTDIIYDFLQVLLINYLAVTKKDGIFTHSSGVKDLDKSGLLFTGKSESGKTTLAKIYHKYSRGMVLNDDRIVVRKINNDFYIYGSPWHGDFDDYLRSRIDRAKLKSIFFLRKAKENAIKPLSLSKAFRLLYPTMFPTFWDREGTKTIAMLLTDLLSKVSSYRLKFKKDKSVIRFIKRIDFSEPMAKGENRWTQKNS